MFFCVAQGQPLYREFIKTKLLSTQASELYIRKTGIQLICGRFECQWFVAVLLKMTCVKVQSQCAHAGNLYLN